MADDHNAWQPIETAPKTGDNYVAIAILAFCPNEYHNAETGSDDRIRIVWWEPELRCWNDDRDSKSKRPAPTYWQPLPKVPIGSSTASWCRGCASLTCHCK